MFSETIAPLLSPASSKANLDVGRIDQAPRQHRDVDNPFEIAADCSRVALGTNCTAGVTDIAAAGIVDLRIQIQDRPRTTSPGASKRLAPTNEPPLAILTDAASMPNTPGMSSVEVSMNKLTRAAGPR